MNKNSAKEGGSGQSKITEFFGRRRDGLPPLATTGREQKESVHPPVKMVKFEYPELEAVERIRQKVGPPTTSGEYSPEPEQVIPNWCSTLFDTPEGRNYASRFCPKLYRNDKGRDAHEKKFHTFERGYAGPPIQLRAHDSIKEKWSPEFPPHFEQVSLDIGILVRDTELDQTVASFHIETLQNHVSDAEVLLQKSRHQMRSWNSIGQSHGHLIPIGSCRSSMGCLEASFDPKNFAPQNGQLNSIAWRGKESHGRKLAEFWHVHVFNGVVLPPGSPKAKDSNGKSLKIPAYWWSLLLLERDGTDILYDSFLFENQKTEKSFWHHRCSLQTLQEVTALEFKKILSSSPQSLSKYGRSRDFATICKQMPLLCGVDGCLERCRKMKTLRAHKVFHSDPQKLAETKERNRVNAAKSREKKRAH